MLLGLPLALGRSVARPARGGEHVDDSEGPDASGAVPCPEAQSFPGCALGRSVARPARGEGSPAP
eukprot:8292460-Lingulodinium_polyedra.AAC.1